MTANRGGSDDKVKLARLCARHQYDKFKLARLFTRYQYEKDRLEDIYRHRLQNSRRCHNTAVIHFR